VTKRNWADGVLGNTPLNAKRLNQLESDLSAALAALARDPESLFAGAVQYDANGAPVSAVVKWPDGIDGTYAGTASVSFPGSVSAYTITRVLNGNTVTYTQPSITRDGVTGNVTNRPEIVVTGETVEEYLYPDPVAPSDLDAALVGKINDTGSDTRTTLDATYAAIVEIDARNYADLPAAVAAVNATGGRCILRIPPGAHTLGATLAFTVPNVRVEASGALITLANGVNASMVTVSDVATGFTWNGGLLDGNRTNQAGTSHGVHFLEYLGGLRPADRGGLNGVTVQNLLTDGIRIEKGRVQIQLADNTSVRNYTRYGVYMGGTDCRLQNGAVGIGQTGVMLDGFANWVVNNGIYSATDAAVRISEKGRYSFVSINSIDNNPGKGLAIEGVAADTVDATITGNLFRANSQAGEGLHPSIYISQARAILLTGNKTVVQTDRVRTSYAVSYGSGVADVYDIANAWEPLAHVSGIHSDSSKIQTRSTALSGNDIAYAQRVNGDTANRVQITAAGTIQFGPGNAAPDASLYRETTNLMGTGQQFFVQRLQVRGTAGAGYVEYVNAQTTTPSTPAAGAVREFYRLNGSSKFEKCVRTPSGTVHVIWTEP